MIVFKILFIFFVALAIISLIVGVVAFVLGIGNEYEPTEEIKMSRETELAHIRECVESFEIWEREYLNARAEKDKRLCEYNAMKSFSQMEQAMESLKKSMVKEVENERTGKRNAR